MNWSMPRCDDRGMRRQTHALVQRLERDAAGWSGVAAGESDALVLRSADGDRFAKIVGKTGVEELRAERDRIEWLAATNVPGASVLDWHEEDDGALLVTSSVAGVPADVLDAAALARAWPFIAAQVRELHALPVEDCPFELHLNERMQAARKVVGDGRVHAEFLPLELVHLAPREILAELERQVPAREAQEAIGMAICHGDLCLPNILIDPTTSRVTGLIDLGRLGRADAHADLALLFATARETWTDPEQAADAEAAFRQIYGGDVDDERLRFYLWLDPLTW